jgi:hypothetical protein
MDFSRYNEELSTHLGDIIRETPLVDTGLLWTTAYAEITEDFDILVWTQDYGVFLEERFTPVTRFLNSERTKQILEEALQEYLIEMINQP